ncbi:solute carrier family 51 subunit beta isoform X2 [Rhincodon typus]|uniref:solute carrier family 51 subunit beta isoform X2 n=1 Tax=Rhincodon typus TaxID=259920 RepID=UPI0020305426|nr:solute carrier family 51 subunit beta isoform X2 [Rhincodon typus]XP_048471755.1 solute carrier family 51 subunit beta isoform X2 [Rhincodon typus]
MMHELKRNPFCWLILCLVLQGNPETTSAKTQMLPAQFEESLDGVISDVRQNNTQVEETTTEKQQPYPMEDSTNWNYAMLVLAFIALFLGFLILVLCSRTNKKKKMKEVNELKNRRATESDPVQKTVAQYTDENDSSAETDQMLHTKQAHISFEQTSQNSSPKISSKPGEIMIEWKDGNISSLFMDAKEDDV